MLDHFQQPNLDYMSRFVIPTVRRNSDCIGYTTEPKIDGEKVASVNYPNYQTGKEH